MTARRDDIQIARAFAAICVVLIHLVQYFATHGLVHFSRPLGTALVRICLLVSLPTFMFLAGMVLALGRRPVGGLRPYLAFQRRKFMRLIPPYVVVSLLGLGLKLLAPGGIISPGEIPRYLAGLLVAPRSGPSAHLWFLYCLMVIFLIWPLLTRRVAGGPRAWLPAALAIVAILPIPWPNDARGHSLLALRDVAWYLPMFAFGYWYVSRGLHTRTIRPPWIFAAWLVFALGFVFMFTVDWPGTAVHRTIYRVTRMIASVAVAPALLWTSALIASRRNLSTRCLTTVGTYSYDIYLLHAVLIGHPFVFLLAKLHPGVAGTYALFVLSVVVVPLMAMALGIAIRCVPWAALVILGVPIGSSPGRGREQRAAR